MDYGLLQQYMKSFSFEELKGFLGFEIVDQLIEWDDRPVTKALLVQMIASIHGYSILKNRDFRFRLMKSMPKDEVSGLRDYLSGSLRHSENIESIAYGISRKQWQDNDICGAFLNLLNLNHEEVFSSANEDSNCLVSISSGERFFELLDYQFIIRQQALNVIESQTALSRLLIHMPTGTGKTKTASHIACHHLTFNLKKKGLILWVAHTKELLQQAFDTLSSVWGVIGDGETSAYRLWGSIDADIPQEGFNGIMVCGLQKLQSIKDNDPNLYEAIRRDARLIIFDEAHKASAKKTREAIEGLMNRKGGLEDRSLMGLTATPGRTTEASSENISLSAMFGSRIIGINTDLMNAVNLSQQEALNAQAENNVIRYFQNRKVLAKIRREQLAYEEELTAEELNSIRIVATDNGYDDYSNHALEIIGRNKSRNHVIKRRLHQLANEGIPTIVFACSVTHAKLLSAMLTLDDVENAVVVGDMTPSERASSISRFKDRDDSLNLLINYEVLTTGFDATNIACVFIARPTKSVVLYSQMLGRGLRGPKMGGNEECLLIDIKDNLVRFNGESTYEYFSMYWEF